MHKQLAITVPHIFVAVLALELSHLAFAELEEGPYATSKVESGLYVLVLPLEVTTVLKSTHFLTYLIQRADTNENRRTVWLPEDNRFRFRAELLSTNGTPVPKTKLGRQIGSKFDEIPFDPSKVELRREKTIPTRIGRMTDLFELRENGKYILRFQLQVFVSDPPDKRRRLLRFPPC